MVSLVKSHTNATRIGRHLWEIDLGFAPVLGTEHVLVAKTIINRANVKPEIQNLENLEPGSVCFPSLNPASHSLDCPGRQDHRQPRQSLPPSP
jgi:hypothetical protein